MRQNDIFTIEKKLKENTIIDPETNCWLYQGAKLNGTHCALRFEGKRVYIHRLSAKIHWGFDLDSSLLILHRCSSSICWNPDHLYEGTHDDNMKDKTDSITHCLRGHEFTEENTYTYMGKRHCRICDRMRHGYV